MKIISRCEKDTFALAADIAKTLRAGDVILLHGELGAGKTTFTKGLAKALGIEETVTSPTFNYVKEYQGGRLPLFHFDMYRVSDADEVYELGLEEYFYRRGVVVVEWNKFDGIERPIEVSIRSLGGDVREIEIDDKRIDG